MSMRIYTDLRGMAQFLICVIRSLPAAAGNLSLTEHVPVFVSPFVFTRVHKNGQTPDDVG
jgi:hypothetical protein